MLVNFDGFWPLPPSVGSFFTTIHWLIWSIFDPSSLTSPDVPDVLNGWSHSRLSGTAYIFLKVSDLDKTCLGLKVRARLCNFSRLTKVSSFVINLGAVHKLCRLRRGGGQKFPILRQHSLWTAPYKIQKNAAGGIRGQCTLSKSMKATYSKPVHERILE